MTANDLLDQLIVNSRNKYTPEIKKIVVTDNPFMTEIPGGLSILLNSDIYLVVSSNYWCRLATELSKGRNLLLTAFVDQDCNPSDKVKNLGLYMGIPVVFDRALAYDILKKICRELD